MRDPNDYTIPTNRHVVPVLFYVKKGKIKETRRKGGTLMLFQTTKGQEALRAQIRQFAEEEIRPQAFLMDQNNEFPEEAIRKLGERGWMGLPYPDG